MAGVLVVKAATGGDLPRDSGKSYVRLPLAFEPNRGQAAPNVKFVARTSGSIVAIGATGIDIALGQSKNEPPSAGVRAPSTTTPEVVRLELLGARVRGGFEGREKLEGKSNYLLGRDPARWIKNVPTFGRVAAQDIYPGIGVAYYGNAREMEFDFILSPGANPRAIRLKVSLQRAPASLRVDSNGDLVISAPTGDVRLRRPRAWQEIGKPSARRFIPAHYVVADSGEVSFAPGDYDRTKPLIIDPVLSYSGYLGGTDFSYASGIAVDAAGSAYLTGYTSSANFPVEGGVQGTFAGGSCNTEVNTAPCFDAFIAKLNPQGTALAYSTYLGGTGDDRGVRLAVNSAGEAYVAGFTNSLDFPLAGAFQGASGGGTCGTQAYPETCYDAFVAKLSASGSGLIYCSYLGGSGDDFARDIAVDAGGNAYVIGLTSSANFPVTYGALQTTFGGGPFDGFVTKLGPSGAALVYSSYLGGSGEDQAAAIALDASGNAYLTGQTNSVNFPTRGGFQPTYTAATCGSELSSFPCFEAFVSKLNDTGSALTYSSYLGGTAASYGNAIALDSALNAYIAGWTTCEDFPVTPSAYQASYNGSNEGFVAKVSPAGDALAYATYLGGTNPDVANTIGVDASGNAYVAGYAYGGGFPLATPLQTASGGFYDAFVSKLDASGSRLLFSTYLGGSGNDDAKNLTLDAAGNLYVAGATFSTNFPATPAALLTAYPGGSYAAWIAKIAPQDAAGLTAVPNPLTFANREINTSSAPQTVKLSDAGSAPLGIAGIATTGDFAQTNSCGDTLAPATTCSVNVTFIPTAPGMRTGTLTVNDTAAGSPHTVQLSGSGASGAVSLSATTLNFGSVPVGTTSRAQTVTLRNLAQSTLNISNIQTLGDYSQSNTCGSTLIAGESCSIAVTFSPASPGTRVGSVVIMDSAADSPQTIALTGTGVSTFSLTAEETSVTVLKGTAQVTFNVSLSAAPDFTGSVALSCAASAPATCVSHPATITQGESSTLTVTNLREVESNSLSVIVTATLKEGTLALTTSSDETTATLTLTVRFADFTLAVAPSEASVNAGQTVTFALTLSPVNGFNLTVSLACAGAPETTSCSVTPQSVSLDGTAPGEATLQFATTARSLPAPPEGYWPSPAPGWRLWAMLGLILALLVAEFHAPEARRLVQNTTLVALTYLLLSSCGGGESTIIPSPPGSSGTPAGTYTLTTTATAESLRHSRTVKVTVR